MTILYQTYQQNGKVNSMPNKIITTERELLALPYGTALRRNTRFKTLDVIVVGPGNKFFVAGYLRQHESSEIVATYLPATIIWEEKKNDTAM